MEQLHAELDAHMAEMDRRLVERLEQILHGAHTHRPYQPMAELSCPSGRLVHYDELGEPDGANIEYLKSITREEPVPVPRPPRRRPRPQRLERRGRDAERRAQRVREWRQQPVRVFAR